MELAAGHGTAESGGLIMVAIAHVFTISYVANLLGEDEDWLHELLTDCSQKTAASGSTVSASEDESAPSPKTASTTCAR